jgi:hypothetical protein
MLRFAPRRQQQSLLENRKGTSVPKAMFRHARIGAVVVCVFGLLFFSSGDNTSYDMGFLRAGVVTAADPVFAGPTIQEWVDEVETKCQEIMSNNNRKDTAEARTQKEQIEREAISKITFPLSVSGAAPSHHEPYQYCRNVFIDLGTNIGDSIGYFVDSALDVCTATWLDALPKTKLNSDFPRPHLNVTSLEITHKGVGSNPLYGMIQQRLRATNPPRSPNSFCVYGMEGNPLFTERLQKLENHIMQAQPRPIQHIHIHTESVVTAVDGPTKLYLDKTSVDKNVSDPSFMCNGCCLVSFRKCTTSTHHEWLLYILSSSKVLGVEHPEQSTGRCEICRTTRGRTSL